MPINSLDWTSSIIAKQNDWSWEIASPENHASAAGCATDFLQGGGCGNPSINDFVKKELRAYSSSGYANTAFLTDDSTRRTIGFVSNSMGNVKLNESEWMEHNLPEPPPQQIPALFLHRLGTHIDFQKKGIGRLLILRVCETLLFACKHTAAPVIALLVEKENNHAKNLYAKHHFGRVESYRQEKLELWITNYDSVKKIIRATKDAIAAD